MKFLESKNIIHRNLTARSILVTRKRNNEYLLKIGGFGLAKQGISFGRNPKDVIKGNPKDFFTRSNRLAPPIHCPPEMKLILWKCGEELPEDRYANWGELETDLKVKVPDSGKILSWRAAVAVK